jgi:hypothetical protein
MKKQTIQVRVVPAEYSLFNSSAPYTVKETIQRVPWGEAIGNFNPIFCRYKGERTLVHSEEGDISDPFRREESYLKTLFIRVYA